jgi:hypothetical protein
MHIKVTVASVCGQGRKVEALESKIMKLVQKPCEFLWQHRENRKVAQFPYITMLDLSKINVKGPMLAAGPCRQPMCAKHDVSPIKGNISHNVYNVNNAKKCNNPIETAYFGPLPYIPIRGPSSSAVPRSSIRAFQMRLGRKELPVESVQSSAAASPSSNQHCMASNNS